MNPDLTTIHRIRLAAGALLLLAALGGPDAYYALRVWQGEGISERQIFFDNLFFLSIRMPDYARNKDGMRLRLSDAKKFTWFVEIMDSNRMEDVNIAIFSPLTTFAVEMVES